MSVIQITNYSQTAIPTRLRIGFIIPRFVSDEPEKWLMSFARVLDTSKFMIALVYIVEQHNVDYKFLDRFMGLIKDQTTISQEISRSNDKSNRVIVAQLQHKSYSYIHIGVNANILLSSMDIIMTWGVSMNENVMYIKDYRPVIIQIIHDNNITIPLNPHAHRYICNNLWSHARLSSLDSSKCVEIVRNKFDGMRMIKHNKLSRQDLALSDSAFIIGYVGAICQEKNLHILVRALEYLPDNYYVAIMGEWLPGYALYTSNLFMNSARVIHVHAAESIGDFIDVCNCVITCSEAPEEELIFAAVRYGKPLVAMTGGLLSVMIDNEHQPIVGLTPLAPFLTPFNIAIAIIDSSSRMESAASIDRPTLHDIATEFDNGFTQNEWNDYLLQFSPRYLFQKIIILLDKGEKIHLPAESKKNLAAFATTIEFLNVGTTAKRIEKMSPRDTYLILPNGCKITPTFQTHISKRVRGYKEKIQPVGGMTPALIVRGE